MKQWYEKLFEDYANRYEKECFTQGTVGECDFLEQEFDKEKIRTVLDIGCGTGRHSIEMARRGYSMTGVDLSGSMLAKARDKAAGENLTVHFLEQDARELKFNRDFDGVMMLCEGSFPLMETDEMNFWILENAFAALRAGGKFIFTTLNGLFPLFHDVQAFLASESQEGNARYERNTFDMMTFRDHNITTVVDDSGKPKELECNERYYVPSEITWLLKSVGFYSVEIYGAKLGAFSRNDKLRTDDYEMLVIAEKSE